MTTTSAKTIEIKCERTIPATPEELYDAWLNPKVPGTTWHEADKLLLDARVDGFFYWLVREHPHYGRFTEMERPARMRYTWMSQSTHGEESTVTVTFEKQGERTLMTLLHTGLPDSDGGRGHEKGWNYFVGGFAEHFGDPSRKEK